MPLHNRRDLLRHEFIAGDIIHEEQRLCALAREYRLMAVIDEILTDGIPAIETGGDFGFCADAIG